MLEMTREIYWNVGHWTPIPMYLIVIATLPLLVLALTDKLKVYKRGKALDRLDQLSRRVIYMLTAVLFQKKVAKGAGIFHAIFFWAFLVLLAGTTLIFIQEDILRPLFGVTYLKGSFYLFYSLALDLAGLVAIIMLGGLFVRRYIVRAGKLNTSVDDEYMHAILFSILITGFLIEGVRMASTELRTNLELAQWSPVGYFVGSFMVNWSLEVLSMVHRFLWWVHFFFVIGFFASVPNSKFKHMLFTSANYLFTEFKRKGSLETLNLEDEESESFGVGKVEDFTWKDIFDADACTKCQRCQDRCPAWATDKPLSPMQVVLKIGDQAYGRDKSPLMDYVEKDVLWSCTTCRACQDICPADIEHVNKIINMRRNLVLMEGEFPGEEVMSAMDNTEVNGNPLGIGYASRGDWAEGMGLSLMEEDPEVDVLYYVGCYASFDKRNIKIAKAFVQLCQAAGLKVGILGKEEKCCGEPMRKMGNEYLYQAMAMENIEVIKAYAPKQIVTTCPHCYNTLDRDYRDLDFDLPVEHYTQFLDRLVKEGKLKIPAGEAFGVAYHDSCYMGRYNGVYDAPRNLIQAAGGRVEEIAKSREEGFCCGAGGGRIMAEEHLGNRINVTRVNQLDLAGASTLVSNCPFCLTMMEDGVKGAGKEERLTPKDLAEILAERLAPVAVKEKETAEA